MTSDSKSWIVTIEQASTALPILNLTERVVT